MLGTKLHQQTRKAISKRKPALMTAIRKFNKYCETLESLHQPSWSIPLPQPLPTELAALRDGPTLREDVWISPSCGDVPRWLEDPDVREGIQAMLKVDRCSEERQRLRMEADNLCQWFHRELAAVELSLRTPSSTSDHNRHLTALTLSQIVSSQFHYNNTDSAYFYSRHNGSPTFHPQLVSTPMQPMLRLFQRAS